LVKVEPLLEVVGDWREFLSEPEKAEEAAALRQRERTGRPLGSESFIVWLEGVVGRGLRPRKRGPEPGMVRSYVWCPNTVPILSGDAVGQMHAGEVILCYKAGRGKRQRAMHDPETGDFHRKKGAERTVRVILYADPSDDGRA
jgi:hypothetical protein